MDEDEILAQLEQDYQFNEDDLAEYMARPEERGVGEKLAGAAIPSILGGIAAAAVGGPVGLFALAAGNNAFDAQGREDAQDLQNYMQRNSERAEGRRTRMEELQDQKTQQGFQLEQLEKSHEMQLELENLRRTPTPLEFQNTQLDLITAPLSTEVDEILDTKNSKNISPEGKEWANAFRQLMAKQSSMDKDQFITEMQELMQTRNEINPYLPDFFGSLPDGTGGAMYETMNSSEAAYESMTRMRDILLHMESEGVSLTGTQNKAWWFNQFQTWGIEPGEANEMAAALESGVLDVTRVLSQAFKPVSGEQMKVIQDSLRGGSLPAAIAAIESSMFSTSNEYDRSYQSLSDAGAGAVNNRPSKLPGSDDLKPRFLRDSYGSSTSGSPYRNDPVMQKYSSLSTPRPF
ncbi:hypothetical protein VCHA35O137_30170 [Vibrio chagasii]|nr:hypothetical protein VCHA35O137_30170 [Vibrio chagasii]CAH7444905.1 hypothetical protein VCHA48O429_30208 [Vibrio chagasii]